MCFIHFVSLKVAIVAQDLAAFHTASSEMGHQQHSHHLVTTETRPLTLVATSNGTQIAVQVSAGIGGDCSFISQLPRPE